ncbi:MAG: PEGA domain-containing protein [Candidatus Eisenbacteria bacterium]|nr:PEGA domain-containing protein [Candidatus Eisenbacteria bacterium]MBM3321779.1 serine/threonine protein kinase [Candidatus Eisenbacteria bacterium]
MTLQSTLITVLATLLVVGVLLLLFLLRRGAGATGTSLGPYRDLSLLSDKGGMAKVYFATNSETGKACVLKVLRQELLGDADIVRKFRREVDILKSLKSADPKLPVPEVYRSGTVSAGIVDIPFIEMEYIPGNTHLGDLLRQKGRLTVEESELVIAQVCRALMVAHRLGIVHRDLKPANILLADGRHDSVVVIDFGVAKLLGGGSVTAGGYGTAAYMAVEQCGGVSQVTPAADVYSLGVVWYEMLTGHKLYDHENPIVVMRMHEEENAAAHVHRHAPRATRAILTRMLARDPAHRPNVAGVLAALSAGAKKVKGYEPSRAPSRKPAGPRLALPRRWILAGASVLAILVPLVVVIERGATGGGGNSGGGKKRPDPPGSPFQLPPGILSGTLSLVTTPSGAQVFYTGGTLNDQAGRALPETTPVSRMPFPVGRQKLYIQLENHESVSLDVQIEPERDAVHRLTMVPGKGSLTMGALPEGVQAILDGQILSVSRIERLPVPVGSHVIAFRSSRYKEQSVRFDVERIGQEVKLPLPVFSDRTGSVRVRTTPAGARLAWDGTARGTVPADGKTLDDVAVGSHSIELSADGYETYRGTVEVVEGTTREVSIALELPPGRLRASASRAAEVRVASENAPGSWRSVGRTPAVVTLPAGRYRVRLEVPGYDSWETSVTIESGRDASVSHAFPEPGRLVVGAKGPWGNVFVNGVSRGSTPLEIGDLKPGTYTVEVKRDGYTTYSTSVTIPAGGTARVTAELR